VRGSNEAEEGEAFLIKEERKKKKKKKCRASTL
jgi:hypothetical protein